MWTDKIFARAAGVTTKPFAKVQINFVNNINCKKYFKFHLPYKIKWLPSGAYECGLIKSSHEQQALPQNHLQKYKYIREQHPILHQLLPEAFG